MKAYKNVSMQPGPLPMSVTREEEVVCTSRVGMWDRRAVFRGCLGPDHGLPCLGPFLAVGHGTDHQAVTRGLSVLSPQLP